MKEKWTTNDIPELTNKIAVVTGANSGIGYEAAKILALKNARVIMACRNLQKGEDAASQIQKDYPEAMISVEELDLGSQQSIRDFAENYLGENQRLDLLINNAGVMMPPYGKTSDGFELQFGTNHLGHFALTGLLLPMLIKTPGSRVVNVSSAAHKSGKINFDDLNSVVSYNKMKAYGQSKLANLLFTYELQRRFKAAGSESIATAAHPGWTETNLQRHAGGFKILNPVFGQSGSMGALPTLRAACDPEASGSEYFGPAGFMEMKGYPVRVESNTRSHDQETAKRLWDVSEEMTGVKFKFSLS